MTWFDWVLIALGVAGVGMLVWGILTGRVSKDNVLYIVKTALAVIRTVEEQIKIAGSGEAKKKMALENLCGLADEAVLSPLIDVLVSLQNLFVWKKPQ